MTKKFLIGISAILSVYIFFSWLTSELAGFDSYQIQSLIFAGALATLNILTAYIIVKLSIHRGQKEFSKIFLSGMVIRILFLLIIIFLVLKYTQANDFVFIGSLFILYFVYQVWEVLFLNSAFKQEK